MGVVWHDDAMTAFAAADAAGTDLVIDSFKIGSLTSAQRYDAVGNETGPKDTTPETFTANITLNQGGPTLDIILRLPRPASARVASEIYYYAGNQIMAVRSLCRKGCFHSNHIATRRHCRWPIHTPRAAPPARCR